LPTNRISERQRECPGLLAALQVTVSGKLR
jgi:hypothetical protein